MTLRRIAEKIDYSPMAIYLYFKDKRDILLHLTDEGFALLNARLDLIEAPDPLQRLRLGAAIYLDFAVTQPHYYKIMFQLEDQALTDASTARGEMQQRAFAFMRNAVQEATERGCLAIEVDGDVMAYAMWATIHGVASLALSGRLSRLPKDKHTRLYESAVEAILRGFQTPALL